MYKNVLLLFIISDRMYVRVTVAPTDSSSFWFLSAANERRQETRPDCREDLFPRCREAEFVFVWIDRG